MFRIENITGTMVNYYFSCKRQLWLFSRYIKMEESSDIVLIGKLIHEKSYKRKKKEIMIDGVKIDFIENKKGSLIVNEVKKARSLPEAHQFQLLYYLYVLKQKGIVAEGQLTYPEQRRKEKVILNEENEQHLIKVLNKILDVINADKPLPEEKIKICTKCSYYDFCWS